MSALTTAILALGSVSWLEKDLDQARALYSRSLALEERAESDLNLGRVELALHPAGDATAHEDDAVTARDDRLRVA